MTTTISIVETELIDEKVNKIMRQTDYSKETALEKLKEHNFDEIITIRSYLGIDIKKNNKNDVKIKSINQEIYKQLRYKLNTNMKDYQERVEKGEVKKII
jgi:hypothetical protein